MDTEKMIKRIQRVSLSCDLKTDEGIRHFHNGHEYVEIGGIKWATMNIGAEKPTDCGFYFQWGDIQGYTASQVGSGEGEKAFMWRDYKYGDGTSFPSATGFTKYNSTDGKTVLDLEDDAVRYHWGGSWRMPTKDELIGLRNTVNIEWIANYNGSGVNGFLCTDKNNSTKVLFFPSAGFAYNRDVDCVGRHRSFVWSSSRNGFHEGSAWRLLISDKDILWGSNYYRYYGYTVRGVVG